MHASAARPYEAPLPDPLGFLLTWTTYGAWLPGDVRGWYSEGQGIQPPDPRKEAAARAAMTEPAAELNDEQRALVEREIAAHCRDRGWELFAVNCRTNHVHVVVAGNLHPERIRDQFKARCTRKLKEHLRLMHGAYAPIRKNWWTEKGSQRYLNDEESLAAAIRYVLEGQ